MYAIEKRSCCYKACNNGGGYYCVNEHCCIDMCVATFNTTGLHFVDIIALAPLCIVALMHTTALSEHCVTYVALSSIALLGGCCCYLDMCCNAYESMIEIVFDSQVLQVYIFKFQEIL